MSFIQNLFSSRDNNANTETYVGQTDRIWYNPDNNTFRISDGNTPGGLPIDYSSNANVSINNLTANTIGTDDSSVLQFITDVNFREFVSVEQDLTVSGNIVVAGNISAATETKIGGVRAGPGANIGNTGLLTIDTTGLPLSFGNFTANNNILTIVNNDENMILATQGSAEIQLIGNIGFYRTDGLPPNVANRFFSATDSGQITILVPTEDPITGGVEIIGSATGNFIAPGTAGTMLHLTGNPNVSCRLYQDSLNSYSSFVGRRYNGTTASPTQVLAGEDVLRFNATAATDAGVGNVALAQISITALEDQTTTAQGSEITFTVTPIGSPAASRVDVANITVANGVTATQFTTSGNVVANVIVAASAGNINLAGNLIPTANTYTLGTEDVPWQSAYFGPESITLLDTTGNTDNTVVIENAAGNITMSTAGFDIQTLGTTDSIFRIEAITGQIYSNANTIIQNATDAANTTSGSLQTAGGAGIAKNLYVGANANIAGNLAVTGNVSTNTVLGGNLQATSSAGGKLTNSSGTTQLSWGAGGGNNLSISVPTSFSANVTSNLSVTGNITGGNILTAGLISVTGNISGGNLAVSGTAAITGNASAGNLSATNYTGLVTHAVRDAGDVDGGTVTLNMTTDAIVKCTFNTGGMTVAFSNIIPGRTVTLLAEKTDGATDNINTGIASTNMSNGDNTSPVDGLCTAVLTYYSLGTTTDDIYCQIVSAI